MGRECLTVQMRLAARSFTQSDQFFGKDEVGAWRRGVIERYLNIYRKK